VAFLVFTLGGATIGWFLLPFARAGGRSPLAQQRRNRQVIFGGYRFFAWALHVLGLVEYKPPPLTLPKRPYVLVSNHPSLLDVMMLLGTFPDMTVLVKASWFESRFIGPLLRGGGYLPGPSSTDSDDGAPVLDRIVATLREGTSVLIFPEGSRSPPGELRRFRIGAVEAARRAEVPLLPILLRCNHRTLLKGQAWHEGVPHSAIRYDVTLWDPMRVAKDVDVRAVNKALRERYVAALGISERARAAEKTAEVTELAPRTSA
jgi:1-acyl-sn-glycerol-3-phosphate acyltransferase